LLSFGKFENDSFLCGVFAGVNPAQHGKVYCADGRYRADWFSALQRLKACGNEVIIFARNPEKARQQLPDAKKYVRWEALESEGEWQRSWMV
jgi:hypothetical protein